MRSVPEVSNFSVRGAAGRLAQSDADPALALPLYNNLDRSQSIRESSRLAGDAASDGSDAGSDRDDHADAPVSANARPLGAPPTGDDSPPQTPGGAVRGGAPRRAIPPTRGSNVALAPRLAAGGGRAPNGRARPCRRTTARAAVP